MNLNFDYAVALDSADPLASFREEFIIPERNGKQQIYFLGNSLGLPNRNTKARMDEVMTQWATFGVEAFFMGTDPWMHYHDHLTGPLSRVIGTLPSELVVMNQLTVNLHLLLASFYRPLGNRKKILCEAKAFPSDQYMLETHLRFLGLDPGECIIEVTPRSGEQQIRMEDILAAIEENASCLALVFWGGLNYYTGQFFDIPLITRAAHAVGALAGFDLAHAAGNVALQLHDWNVDFAAWCNYKYLNAGPGAIGAAYIHERYHKDSSLNRLAGWWGYDKATRFQMEKGFKPMETAEGWQVSTPSAFQYAGLRGSLEIIERAGFARMVEKGLALSDYLIYLLDDLNRSANAGIEIITPRENANRGCQVSLLFSGKGKSIFDGLHTAGIFADWREPNVIRVAPVPLYNRFTEVWQFADTIRRML